MIGCDLPLLVQERRVHGLRILRAQLENVADLDPLALDQRPSRSAGRGRPCSALRRS